MRHLRKLFDNPLLYALLFVNELAAAMMLWIVAFVTGLSLAPNTTGMTPQIGLLILIAFCMIVLVHWTTIISMGILMGFAISGVLAANEVGYTPNEFYIIIAASFVANSLILYAIDHTMPARKTKTKTA